jgi:hypothetical protein
MRLIHGMILREKSRPTQNEAGDMIRKLGKRLEFPVAGHYCLFIANKTSYTESFEDFCKRVEEVEVPKHFRLDQFFISRSGYGLSGQPPENTFFRLTIEKDHSDFAQAYEVSPEVQEIVNEGQQQEAEGNWFGALGIYENGMKKHPDEAHLTLRFTRALFHPDNLFQLGVPDNILYELKRESMKRTWDVCSQYPADGAIAALLGDIYYYQAQNSIANAVESDGIVVLALQDEQAKKRLYELAYLQYARATKLIPADSAIRIRYLELCRAIDRGPEEGFFNQS